MVERGSAREAEAFSMSSVGHLDVHIMEYLEGAKSANLSGAPLDAYMRVPDDQGGVAVEGGCAGWESFDSSLMLFPVECDELFILCNHNNVKTCMLLILI
jgi:hypothetical protein